MALLRRCVVSRRSFLTSLTAFIAFPSVAAAEKFTDILWQDLLPEDFDELWNAVCAAREELEA